MLRSWYQYALNQRWTGRCSTTIWSKQYKSNYERVCWRHQWVLCSSLSSVPLYKNMREINVHTTLVSTIKDMASWPQYFSCLWCISSFPFLWCDCTRKDIQQCCLWSNSAGRHSGKSSHWTLLCWRCSIYSHITYTFAIHWESTEWHHQ